GVGFVEFHSGAEIPPRSVRYSTPTTVPFDRTQLSVRSGVGTTLEAPIRNRHFDPVGRIRRFPVRRKIPLRERGRWLSMRSHTDTSSLKRA
ncbi:hypothetical protein Taro_055962, partial [Colocasia esculenta]|nr:hypothetical protein [Colocasia esculenta]